MFRPILLLTSLTGICFARPGPQNIKAIDPTESGQIGVNPVTYIGSNTQYFSYDQTTTKWIGVDTVVIQTITVTSNDAVMTTTTGVAFAVSTASVASDGVEPGDLNFIITPAGASQLGDLFNKAASACVPVKLKSRDVASCALEWLARNGPAAEAFGDAAVSAAKTYVALDAGAKVIIGGATYTVGAWAVFQAYQAWQSSKSIAPVIKIPAKNVGTVPVPTTTTSTESSSITLAPIVTGITYVVENQFDTPSAAALATFLQNQFVPAPATTTSAAAVPTCTCTQTKLISGDLTAVQCPLAKDGEPPLDCPLVVSTQLYPAPSPNPAPPALCNDNRQAASFVPAKDSKQVVNRKAAVTAYQDFCNTHLYTFNEQNCPAVNYYPFIGSASKGPHGGKGAAGGIGDGSDGVGRIVLATRWSTGDCGSDVWWNGVDPATTYAGHYISDPEYQNDCNTGFDHALNDCNAGADVTMGGWVKYKCMEYLVFYSGSAKLDLSNTQCAFTAW